MWGTTNDSMFYRIFIVLGSIIVILHIWAALQPSSLNWGFNALAFFSVIFQVLILFLMGMALLPSVQQKILSYLESLLPSYYGKPKPTRTFIIVLGIIVLYAILWLGRERIFLMGDGYLLLRTLPYVHGPSETYFFRNEPLPFFIIWKLWQLFQYYNINITEEFVVQVVNIIFSAGSIFMLVILARQIASEMSDRVLVFLFLFVSGTSQLFFGYVENYPLVYLVMLSFIWSSMKSLDGKFSLVIPSILYGILFTSHFGMICMTPAVVVLFYHSYRNGHSNEIGRSLLFLVGTIVLILWICGYSYDIFLQHLFENERRFISLKANDGYSALSVWHLLNIINLQILFSPFALLIVLITLGSKLIKLEKMKHSLPFLLIIALCGFVFTAVINFRIGMSRDWDLLSPFNVGIIITAVFIVVRSSIDDIIRHRILVMITIITMLHSVSWIYLNANEEMYVSRFSMLPDDRLWTSEAMKSAYEELGIYYRGKQNAELAIDNFNKYLSIDSSNTRIMGSLAYIYSLVGDRVNETRILEKAVAKGSTQWEVYLNLGITRIKEGRYKETISLMENSLRLNPGSAAAHYTMGIAILNAGEEQQKALHHFLRALTLDPAYADAYLGAGICYNNLNDHPNARINLKRYLELKPQASNADEIRKILESLK